MDLRFDRDIRTKLRKLMYRKMTVRDDQKKLFKAKAALFSTWTDSNKVSYMKEFNELMKQIPMVKPTIEETFEN